MGNIKNIFLLFLLILVYSFSYCSDNINFANYLFEKGEYYRAISEYHRSMFSNKLSKQDSNHCIVQITKCNYSGENYSESISWNNSLENKSILTEKTTICLNYYSGLSYLKLGYPNSAILCFSKNRNNEKSLLMCGISNLYLYDWKKSNIIFERLTTSKDINISNDAIKLSLLTTEATYLSNKNPILAGILSAIIPGSGYAYAKHYQTAFSSFLLNSILIGTSYEFQRKGFKFAGGTTLLLSFGWYMGNILGSYKSAIRYNNKIRQNYLNQELKMYENYYKKYGN